MNKLFSKFYSFEGTEGSGKSTAISSIKKELENDGHTVIVTREPGGSEVGEKIRELIFNNEIDLKTEVLLFAANRHDHINKVIIPALKKGYYVLCDRFVDSSLVYQGYAMGDDNVLDINKYAVGDAYPHKTFFLKVSPEVSLKRLENRQDEINRFDKKDIEFHNKIYQGYIEFEKESRCCTIDATQRPDKIVKQILENMDI